jgi:hypothetical protein
VDLAFAQADGGVERRKAAEAHRYGRHGSAGAKRSVFLLEDLGEIGGHGLQFTRSSS